MEKKIIAVSLVIILIAVSFVACGKNKGYKLAKDEYGFEHAYVTDAEGNTVLDDNGNIRVYQTDANGEIATDGNGNKKENVVEVPRVILDDHSCATKDFVLKLDKSWKRSEEDGKYLKNGDKANYIEVKEKYVCNEGEVIDLEVYVQSDIEYNESIVKNAGGKATYEQGFIEVKGVKMHQQSFQLVGNDGNLINDSKVYNFVIGDILYEVSYYYYGLQTDNKTSEPYDFLEYFKTAFELKKQ